MVIRKKDGEIWDKVITTEEEWFNIIDFEGALLVHVYQKWCGPCTVLAPFVKAIREEIPSQHLQLIAAQADDIEPLKFYHGKCIPTFLFFCQGRLQDVVRGVNWPAINKCLQNILVVNDSFNNLEIHDIQEFFDPEQQAFLDKQTQQYEEKLKKAPKTKNCALVVLKPDVVGAGKVDEILKKFKNHKFEVLHTQEWILEPQELEVLYKKDHLSEEAIAFLTKSPSYMLIVTNGLRGIDIVDDLKTFIGNKNHKVTKEQHAKQLRTIYGTDDIKDGFYVSTSDEKAKNELHLFFPRFKPPPQEDFKPHELEKTLILVRPDAYKKFGQKKILNHLSKEGFEILMQKEYKMTMDQAEKFYFEKRNEIFYNDLIINMTNGPLFVAGLARENAVQHLVDLAGPSLQSVAKVEQPKSLRAIYSTEVSPVNSIHVPKNQQEAKLDMNTFFPFEKVLVAIKGNRTARVQKKLIVEKIRDAGFKIEKIKMYKLLLEEAEEFYAEHRDQPFYADLCAFMSRMESVFLIVSKQHAIHDFKQLAGDKDPAVAKEKEPSSLRAMFGEDIIKNAIYRSESKEEYLDKVPIVFTDDECDVLSNFSVGNMFDKYSKSRLTDASGSRYLESKLFSTSQLSMINKDWEKQMSNETGTKQHPGDPSDGHEVNIYDSDGGHSTRRSSKGKKKRKSSPKNKKFSGTEMIVVQAQDDV